MLGPKRRITSTEMPASSGRPGPGEMTMRSGRMARDLVERDLVVALDDRRRAQLAEVLGQVQGERIVVVDEQNHSPGFRHGERLQQRPRLVARLLVLGRRVRVGDDAGAGLDARAAVADRDRADRDAEVEVAGEVDVADRAGVDVAARRLELRRGSASRGSSARPTPCRPGSTRPARRGDRGPRPAVPSTVDTRCMTCE